MARLEAQPSYIIEPKSWDIDLLAYGPLELSADVLNVSMAGVATAANQTTGNTLLSGIDGKLPALVGGRIPVVLPAGGTGLTDTELRASAVPMSLATLPALVAGTANIGDVDVLTLPALPAGTNNIGDVDVLTMPVVQVGDNGGSLTVDAPVATPVFVRLSDGAAAIATLPVSLATLPALVAGTANIGDVDVLTLPSLPTGANVIGAISNTSFAATQATAANLNATVVGTGTFAAQVTGSVTANAGTNLNTSALALDASISTLNTSVNTLLKPANTLASVTSVGTLAAQATSYGKTLTYVPVAQGAVGTTVLAAANASARHKIIGCLLTMSAAGTLKFLDGSGDLTGAMDVGATGGFVLPASLLPYQQTALNSALSITTTGGAAKGVVSILTEA